MRAIMPGAASGSAAVLPVKLWPFVTVSRLVPSWLISASSPAWLEEERPSTATIAATPIAIPSAESAGAQPPRAHADAGDAREVGRAQFRGVSRGGVGGGGARCALTAARVLVDERERRRPACSTVAMTT